jgi:hypothetical protein
MSEMAIFQQLFTLTKHVFACGTAWSWMKSDAQTIWDTSETCNNGQCETKPYTVGSQYVQYRMLDGSSQQINNTRSQSALSRS